MSPSAIWLRAEFAVQTTRIRGFAISVVVDIEVLSAALFYDSQRFPSNDRFQASNARFLHYQIVAILRRPPFLEPAIVDEYVRRAGGVAGVFQVVHTAVEQQRLTGIGVEENA